MFRGDTDSVECPYKFRMDVRLLCDSFKKTYNHGTGEFGRSITDSKYYYDKTKLVVIFKYKFQKNKIKRIKRFI